MRTGSERSRVSVSSFNQAWAKAKPYGPQLLVQFLINNVMSRPFLSPKTTLHLQNHRRNASRSLRLSIFVFQLISLFSCNLARFFYLHGNPSIHTHTLQTPSVVSRSPSRLTSRSSIPKPVFMFQPVFARP